MKQTGLYLVFAALAAQVRADDSTYRTAMNLAHERLRILNVERNDYRKREPGLPPEQETERLRLLGQLQTDDPIWALGQQIQADITALADARSQTAADAAIIENLKDLLAITSSFEDRATTRAQAEAFATALRQFVARRDVAGAGTWAKSQ
jgi:hypothetical protein